MPDSAVVEKTIEIKTADGVSGGYLYQPAGSGPWPGVLYLTDIGGIRPAARDAARRIAAEGYAVLMPNIFYRAGMPPVISEEARADEEKKKIRIAELRAALSPEAIQRDASPYLDFLAAQPAVGHAGFAVVGFCISGPMALRIAAQRPDKIAAVATFHAGGLFTDTSASPHLVLPRVKAQLYFGHAVEDRSMPKEAIENFERALAAWGGKFESETYQGAFHSWTATDSPVYNQPQAERAFEKMISLFSSALAGKKSAR
jgi:carboxymethylenebutenolidase